MPGPKNLITAENAIQSPGAAATESQAGEVTKKGAPPPERARKATDGGLVKVRITKAGHGQVHDGEDGRYDWNDEVMLPRPVAEALEGRHYGEIQE